MIIKFSDIMKLLAISPSWTMKFDLNKIDMNPEIIVKNKNNTTIKGSEKNPTSLKKVGNASLEKGDAKFE